MPGGSPQAPQTAGDLVLLDQYGAAKWRSATSGDSNTYAIMQADGNFLVTDNGNVQNPSNTAGHPGAYLVLQNNNNLAVRDANGTCLVSIWGNVC